MPIGADYIQNIATTMVAAGKDFNGQKPRVEWRVVNGLIARPVNNLLESLGVLSMHPSAISKLVQLFQDRGQVRYEGHSITQLQHALQCALFAKRQGAESTLVAAALLHDIGHLIDDHDPHEFQEHPIHDMHEERAFCWLKEHFGPSVADPIRLHVQAKRYLCTIEPEYIHALSPLARRNYYDLGGPMSGAELDDFRDEPYAFEAVQLRRWDDLAVQPDMVTPTLEEYLPLLESLVLEPAY